MLELVWLKRARRDFDEIIAYIDQFDPAAADRMAARLQALAESLREYPDRGRLATGHTREMVTVRPYILRYRVTASRVVIVRVRQGARRPIER